MTPSPQHGTPAGDATIAIRKLARQSGTDTQELMTLYTLEGLLARIALSEYRDDFVLKGGVLLAAFAARRPTKDIDLQATRLGDDPDEVAERVRIIATRDLADGLVFDPASVTATTIRDEDEYAGVRVKIMATLSTARLTVGMDAPMSERAQQKYLAWRIRSHREDELPAAFSDLLAAVAGFADPVLSATATGRWNPRLNTWE